MTITAIDVLDRTKPREEKPSKGIASGEEERRTGRTQIAFTGSSCRCESGNSKGGQAKAASSMIFDWKTYKDTLQQGKATKGKITGNTKKKIEFATRTSRRSLSMCEHG